jgi:hypothetical protein
VVDFTFGAGFTTVGDGGVDASPNVGKLKVYGNLIASTTNKYDNQMIKLL